MGIDDTTYTDEYGRVWRPVACSWGDTSDGKWRITYTCERVEEATDGTDALE